MSAIHVSIKSEEFVDIAGFAVTNSVLGSLVIFAILLILGIIVRSSLKTEGRPSKPQLVVEAFYQFMEGMTQQALGVEKSKKYLGLVMVLFLYIVFGSWLGLVPGVLHITFPYEGYMVPLLRAPMTDINATTALALVAFLTIQYAGISALGIRQYLGKFFNFTQGPTNGVLGFFELFSEFTRLLSFSFRLFGNIFAGEVLLVVISALTRFVDNSDTSSWVNYLGVPFPALVILMEFFVALIQGYVFVNLMTVFIAMATEPPHHDDKGGGDLNEAELSTISSTQLT
jgi:F-type H+-transporting ATPase subunit a